MDMRKRACANRGVPRTRDGVHVRVLRPVEYGSLAAQRGETVFPPIGEHVEIICSHLIDNDHDDQPWPRLCAILLIARGGAGRPKNRGTISAPIDNTLTFITAECCAHASGLRRLCYALVTSAG